ncbi:hypothetical protein K1719_028316 [Acacia pycnantha]|nr:hypothetical protein K1719_028316 [Acacia pycnantha]
MHLWESWLLCVRIRGSHLKKGSRNLDSTQVNGEIGSLADKLWTCRSIADALGDDEADVVITHDLGYQK